MYQQADKELAKIRKELKDELLRLQGMSFDELHNRTVTGVTKSLMNRLKKRNEKSFWKVAQKAYRDAIAVLVEEGYDPDDDDGLVEAWLLGLLDSYNYVTGYLYNPEAERKRLRLSEAMSTAMTYKDRKLYREQTTRFISLWWTQTKQYMIDVVDSAETKAWLDNGVKYAKWVTAKDEKVCKECGPRDERVYPLKSFPPKPHYNCRCRKIPMPKGWKPDKDTNSES